ncbi:MAG: OmpA family protein, partial [Candidatus Tectomicrobia bacterium]|nr:OmpA family protein [Candidatus Tectomicrobia bacterium]
DKAEIRPKAQEALKQAAAVIKEKAKGAVQIEGHTDAKGSDAYNQKLSEGRAKAVRDWLVQKEGVKGVRFVTRGFGSKQPVAPNTKPDGSDDSEGRQKNRRVEIIVKK